MPQTMTTPQKSANLGGVISFPKSETNFPAFKKLSSAIRAAWPVKTAAHVAYLTDTTERAVKFWLAGKTRMSVDAVAALLKTDAGFEILEAIMDGATPEWFLVAKSGQDIRKSRKAIKKEQTRIDAMRAQLNLLDQ